jgi:hypothetical protein
MLCATGGYGTVHASQEQHDCFEQLTLKKPAQLKLMLLNMSPAAAAAAVHKFHCSNQHLPYTI